MIGTLGVLMAFLIHYSQEVSTVMVSARVIMQFQSEMFQSIEQANLDFYLIYTHS